MKKSIYWITSWEQIKKARFNGFKFSSEIKLIRGIPPNSIYQLISPQFKTKEEKGKKFEFYYLRELSKDLVLINSINLPKVDEISFIELEDKQISEYLENNNPLWLFFDNSNIQQLYEIINFDVEGTDWKTWSFKIINLYKENSFVINNSLLSSKLTLNNLEDVEQSLKLNIPYIAILSLNRIGWKPPYKGVIKS
ncbi:hypothetical protein [Oceanobacillus sp. 1P07AA]|uniref:hypothetical protein n=1 Tax=Oceanobacillus sp. 1P07AA TaxID=3132293 RepID=UPI0039A6D7BF